MISRPAPDSDIQGKGVALCAIDQTNARIAAVDRIDHIAHGILVGKRKFFPVDGEFKGRALQAIGKIQILEGAAHTDAVGLAVFHTHGVQHIFVSANHDLAPGGYFQLKIVSIPHNLNLVGAMSGIELFLELIHHCLCVYFSIFQNISQIDVDILFQIIQRNRKAEFRDIIHLRRQSGRFAFLCRLESAASGEPQPLEANLPRAAGHNNAVPRVG